MIAQRDSNPFLVLYNVKQVQAAEVSQRRTAVSSKCFQLNYTCSDRLLAITLPSCSFHLFSSLTVMFPKLSVICVHYVWQLLWNTGLCAIRVCDKVLVVIAYRSNQGLSCHYFSDMTSLLFIVLGVFNNVFS
jgi:hypothetical protein